MVEGLRAAGYDDGEILEINQVTAYFAYANRGPWGSAAPPKARSGVVAEQQRGRRRLVAAAHASASPLEEKADRVKDASPARRAPLWEMALLSMSKVICALSRTCSTKRLKRGISSMPRSWRGHGRSVVTNSSPSSTR